MFDVLKSFMKNLFIATFNECKEPLSILHVDLNSMCSSLVGSKRWKKERIDPFSSLM